MFDEIKPHLIELRKRLGISVASLIVMFFVMFYFHEPILEWIVAPLNSALIEVGKKSLHAADGMVTTNQVGGAFFVALKVSFFAAIIGALPIILSQIWAFVAPALYANEKKMVIPFILGGTIMFTVGVLFAYYVVTPFGFDFLITFGSFKFTPLINIEDYVGFFTKIMFGFGIAFELPVFAYFLALLGMIDDRQMKEFFRYAIVIIFIVSALLTPPDVLTQLLMAGPLTILYGASILIVRMVNPAPPLEENEEEDEDESENDENLLEKKVSSKELLTSSYDFTLPKELIAIHPASPRDSAKLLVYNKKTDKISHVKFSDLEEFIPKECALIFNDTKVIKARLFGKKPSGGKIELLINRAINAHDVNVYIKGKVKVDAEIFFDGNLAVHVKELLDDGSRVVNFNLGKNLLRFEELLPIIDEIGHVPLPPYIQREDNKSDESEYQSVFAKEEGAVAAPTASLHFTKEQHERVCQNYPHAYVTLHVGSGTFKPVECETITEHPMHSEYYDISDKAKMLLDSDIQILSVGTTSTRTIEFYARHKTAQRGEANLFLHPNNKPIRVNHLLTNFHLPKSTLLMLVASFVGLNKAQELYRVAIENGYRFYSYGDAMLILEQ